MTIREYEGPGFALGRGELFEFGRDELPKGYGKGLPGKEKPRQGFSAPGKAPAAPKAENLLDRAQRRQDAGLALSADEQAAFDQHINQRVAAGMHLTGREERRLIELMAALGTDPAPAADEADMIDRMAAL